MNDTRSTEPHWRALERRYARAPINHAFASALHVPVAGRSRIEMTAGPEHFHAGGAVHGTLYFKLMDDAAFYAANSLVPEVFMLTTAFNILMTRPLGPGKLVAEGRWVSGERRVLIAESWLTDAEGREVGRGTGTFMRSRTPLGDLPGYR